MEYDFIEIGTSDFNTLIEDADDNTKGLSIEPIQVYLDNLPNKKNVKKVCLGISNHNRIDKIFYVKPENIKKYNFPNWLRGCNSISQPHPSHLMFNFAINKNKNQSTKKLKRPERINFDLRGLDKLAILEAQDIEIINTKELIKRYNIEKVKYLKLDTEGHDCIILLDYLKNCILNPSLFPNEILFENYWSSKESIEEVIELFQIQGYKVKRVNNDIKLTKINN